MTEVTTGDRPFRAVVCLNNHSASPAPFTSLQDMLDWLAGNAWAVMHITIHAYRPASEVGGQGVKWRGHWEIVEQRGDEVKILVPTGDRAQYLLQLFAPDYVRTSA